MRRLKGIGVSPGVVSGRAVLLILRAHVLRYQIAPARLDHELQRLDDSRGRSREQLVEIQARLAQRRPELSQMFDAQLLMLEDPMLLPRAAAIVREQRVNAEWAVQQVFHEFSAVFEEVADPYLRERKGDVADLVGRLRMNLRQGVSTPRDLLRELDESSVLIADELTPSIAAQVDWTKVRGFATDAGSRTYHTAILARSLDVPAVVGLHNASDLVQAGQLVVIDGNASEVILDPTAEELARAAHHADDHRPAAPIAGERRRPASTADGVPVRLDANIEFPDDLAAARYAGAEGIGLYRSEFLVTSGVEDIRDEDRAVPDLPRHAGGDGARLGDGADLRRRRGADGVAAVAAAPAGGRLGAGRSTGQPPGPARPAPEPDASGAVPHPAARLAARGQARVAADHVSVRVECRADPRGARDGHRRRRRSAAARRSRAGRADRRDDRDPRRRLHRRSRWRARSTSSPSAPTI